MTNKASIYPFSRNMARPSFQSAVLTRLGHGPVRRLVRRGPDFGSIFPENPNRWQT